MAKRDNFDFNHQHGFTTADGRAVEIFTKSRKRTAWEIVGLIDPDNEGGHLTDWTRDGRYLKCGDDHPCDLINAPAPKRRVKGWVALFSDDGKTWRANGPVYGTADEILYGASYAKHVTAAFIDHEIDTD